MKLEITRDEERCLECMFLDGDDIVRKCLLFGKNVELSWAKIKPNGWTEIHFKPCNECNLVWRKK